MPKLSEINQKPEVYLNTIYDFSKHPKGFLLIAGTNGSGKTFSARALYDNFYCEDSDLKMFLRQVDLNLKWQKQIADWGQTTYLLNQIIKTQLLVLDDIGTRIPTDAFMDFLYAIVDERHSNKDSCGTILTTNLNAKDMREKFGDAFVSRVASGKCIRHDGKDRRFVDF